MTVSQLHGGNVVQAAEEFRLPVERFIDFSSNLNVLEPLPADDVWMSWREEMARYPDLTGITERLERIYGIPRGHILPTAGGIEALYLAARLYAGKRVVVLEPSFHDYFRAFDGAGAEVERRIMPPEAWGRPFSELMARGRLPGRKMADAIVFGNPNNPTGTMQKRASLREAMLQAENRDSCWIIDEAFIEFSNQPDDQSLSQDLNEFKNLIVIRSITKSHRIPGLRLGFLASSDAKIMERLRGIQPPWSINGIAQAWAREFLTPEERPRVRSRLAQFREFREDFATGLQSIEGIKVYPSEANFLLIELLAPALKAREIYRGLGRKGILIRTCDSFHGLAPGRFLRVAVRKPDENRRLVDELKKLCAELLEAAA